MAEKKNIWEHWPILALLVIVFVILATALICFQVKETEHVVLLRWKKPQPARNTEPGLRFRFPYPIETLWRHDKRLHVFTGSKGVLEEVLTADGRNVIVTVFITWRVSYDEKDPENTVIRYMTRVGDKKTAEDKLTGLIRSSRRNVLGKYDFSDLVNKDPREIKLAAVEKALLDEIQSQAKKDLAIDVQHVGIAHVGLPQSSTTEVFKTMTAQRQVESKSIEAKGRTEAAKIIAKANQESARILAGARAKAKVIEGEGESAATASYEVFGQYPELAKFLNQLDAMKKILSKETILILDTSTPAINLLSEDALEKLKKEKIKVPVTVTDPNDKKKPEAK